MDFDFHIPLWMMHFFGMIGLFGIGVKLGIWWGSLDE